MAFKNHENDFENQKENGIKRAKQHEIEHQQKANII